MIELVLELDIGEPHYTVKELAGKWHLSPVAIRRLFRNEPGILRYGRPKKGHRRDYVTVRIPHSVAERVYRRLVVPEGQRTKENAKGLQRPFSFHGDSMPHLPKPDAPPRQFASAEQPRMPDSVAP